MADLPSPLRRFAWASWAGQSRRRLAAHGPAALPAALAQAALALTNAALALGDRAPPPPRDPLVIVGHQRSGTTLLHRVLARHPAAVSLPLHALLLPADLPQRRFAARRRPAWLDRAQDRLFGPLDPLHRIRLHEVEEDEFFFWALHRSPMNALDRPWGPQGPPAIRQDELGFAAYADLVARACARAGARAAHAGTPHRYVGKNPHFTPCIPALRAALPGVRVVALLRHPAQAVASRLSLLRAIWKARDPSFGELAPHHVEGLLSNSVAELRGTLDGPDLALRYEELVTDPVGAAVALHERLGLEPWPEDALAALRLAVSTGELRSNERTGRLPLAHFGLDEARLHAAMPEVYERWGWGPRPGAPR